MDTIIREAQTCTSSSHPNTPILCTKPTNPKANPRLLKIPSAVRIRAEVQSCTQSCGSILRTAAIMLSSIQLPSLIHTSPPIVSTPSSPPPLPLLLLLRTSLHPNLILLLLLKPLNLLTINLILTQPVLAQALHILDKALGPSVVHPEAHDEYPAPEDQSQRQVHPEDDGPVHHVQYLERDEEYGQQREDGGDIGLGDEFVEEG